MSTHYLWMLIILASSCHIYDIVRYTVMSIMITQDMIRHPEKYRMPPGACNQAHPPGDLSVFSDKLSARFDFFSLTFINCCVPNGTHAAT